MMYKVSRAFLWPLKASEAFPRLSFSCIFEDVASADSKWVCLTTIKRHLQGWPGFGPNGSCRDLWGTDKLWSRLTKFFLSYNIPQGYYQLCIQHFFSHTASHCNFRHWKIAVFPRYLPLDAALIKPWLSMRMWLSICEVQYILLHPVWFCEEHWMISWLFHLFSVPTSWQINIWCSRFYLCLTLRL